MIGHDAIYETVRGGAHPAGVGSAQAHSYWPIFGLMVAILAVTVVGSGARRIAELRRQLGTGRGSATDSGSRAYHRELLEVWLILFPATIAFFTIQENAEQLAVAGNLAGLTPIVGANWPDGLIVLGLASLTVALFGALIRWRVHVLEERLAAEAGRPRRPLVSDAPASAWHLIAAICRHRWILVRLDLGRAPPVVA
jgi:hypothetical protein